MPARKVDFFGRVVFGERGTSEPNKNARPKKPLSCRHIRNFKSLMAVSYLNWIAESRAQIQSGMPQIHFHHFSNEHKVVGNHLNHERNIWGWLVSSNFFCPAVFLHSLHCCDFPIFLHCCDFPYFSTNGSEEKCKETCS